MPLSLLALDSILQPADIEEFVNRLSTLPKIPCNHLIDREKGEYLADENL